MPDGGMTGPGAGFGGLETKFCQFDQAISVTDGVRIEGYASLFGRVDQGGDVVERGAYAASLARLKAAGRGVKLLWQHDPATGEERQWPLPQRLGSFVLTDAPGVLIPFADQHPRHGQQQLYVAQIGQRGGQVEGDFGSAR